MIKEKVIKAYEFAKYAHEGQVRKFSDLSYFSHPKYVARVIEQLTKDENLVIAALLHDVLEDTEVTEEKIQELFGEIVLGFVKELTSPSGLKGSDKAVHLSEKMAVMSEGGLSIKLADRFHNVLFLEGDEVPVSFVKKYLDETKIIIGNLRKAREKNFNKVHSVLADRIDVICRFLEIRHGWE